MLSDVSVEILKAFQTLLSGQLTYNSKGVPVFAVVASKTVNPAWITISQFNQSESGAKTYIGNRCSILIEVNMKDDYKGLITLTNSMLALIYPSKNPTITLENSTMLTIFEPNINELTEQLDDALYLRKLVRIEFLIIQ